MLLCNKRLEHFIVPSSHIIKKSTHKKDCWWWWSCPRSVFIHINPLLSHSLMTLSTVWRHSSMSLMISPPVWRGTPSSAVICFFIFLWFPFTFFSRGVSLVSSSHKAVICHPDQMTKSSNSLLYNFRVLFFVSFLIVSRRVTLSEALKQHISDSAIFIFSTLRIYVYDA